MAVLLQCNDCGLVFPASVRLWNISLGTKKGEMRARGHLCDLCADKLMVDLKMKPFEEPKEREDQ